MKYLAAFFVFIGVISITRAYDIRLHWEFQQIGKNILESFYPDIYQKYKHTSDPATKIANNLSKQNILSVKERINEIISKTLEVKRNTHKTLIEQVKIQEFPSQRWCRLVKMMFESQITHFTRFEHSFSPFYPGSLVKFIEPTNFAKGIVPIYDNSIKNPISIRVKGQKFQQTFTISNYEEQYNKKIHEVLNKNIQYLRDQPIKLYVLSSGTRIREALIKLGLGSSIYQKLLLSSRPKMFQDETQEKRIVFVLHQRLFSSVLDFSNEAKEQATLFNRIYNKPSEGIIQKFLQAQNRTEELPLLVSQLNYGRLLVLSLIDDEESQNTIRNMFDCFKKDGDKEVLTNIQCFNLVTKKIRSNPTLKSYYAGIDEDIQVYERAFSSFLLKKYLKWKKIFFTFDETSIKSLKPLSINVIDFMEERRKQIDRRYYLNQTCKRIIYLKVDYMNVQILRVSVAVSKQAKHIFNTTHPGTFQIGSYTGNNPFELHFISRSGKKASRGLAFYFLKKIPIYSNQYQFAILINGEQKIRRAVGYARGDRQVNSVRISFDPETERAILDI